MLIGVLIIIVIIMIIIMIIIIIIVKMHASSVHSEEPDPCAISVSGRFAYALTHLLSVSVRLVACSSHGKLARNGTRQTWRRRSKEPCLAKIGPKDNYNSRGQPAEPDFFHRAPGAHSRKMPENKLLGSIKICSETKFHPNWSNGARRRAIYAYLVNHTCEGLR